MSNYLVGHMAEKRAAEFLKKKRFKIVELNWKTRFCEIDIVAEKDGVMYFIEVKYRRNANQGFGLDYLTDKKLKRMSFAAEMWVSNNKWEGNYQLAAISVDNSRITFLEEI